MSFAEQVLECVVREAAGYPDSRVSRVRLRAGIALALEPASLRFCLEAIAADTVMDGAHIEMVEDAELGSELIVEEIELDEEDNQSGGEGPSEGA